MSYSGPVTIDERAGFKLDSYGNGAAYAFAHGRWSVFIQGDDALRFREELDAVDGDSLPGGKDPLAWLWDECGWGEAAEESEF